MNPRSAPVAPRRARLALLLSLAFTAAPACGARYVYVVPVGELARHPVADTTVALRTADGDVVRTTVERVSFDDGRFADLRRPGLGERVTQAARASTGTAWLTVSQRSFAARDGAVGAAAAVGLLGALVGGLAWGALCVDGCGSTSVQVALGTLLGAASGAGVGASLGGLVGAAIDAQRTAAQPATLLDAP
jgi:hypothetical protein